MRVGPRNPVARVFYALGSDTALALLNAINSGCLTTERLDTKLGLPRTTRDRALRRLRRAGLIVRTPGSRYGVGCGQAHDTLEVSPLADDLIRRVLAEYSATIGGREVVSC